MREILFRGKRIGTGKWIEGFYCQRKEKIFGGVKTRHMILVPDADSYSGARWIDVNPTTIGRYTGLTDKNGKKIFDGDIVFYYCSDITAVVKFGQYIDLDSPNKPAIGFYSEYSEDGKTVQESMDSRESDQEYGCEVIGNIHDNPELLEVGE